MLCLCSNAQAVLNALMSAAAPFPSFLLLVNRLGLAVLLDQVQGTVWLRLLSVTKHVKI